MILRIVWACGRPRELHKNRGRGAGSTRSKLSLFLKLRFSPPSLLFLSSSTPESRQSSLSLPRTNFKNLSPSPLPLSSPVSLSSPLLTSNRFSSLRLVDELNAHAFPLPAGLGWQKRSNDLLLHGRWIGSLWSASSEQRVHRCQ